MRKEDMIKLESFEILMEKLQQRSESYAIRSAAKELKEISLNLEKERVDTGVSGMSVSSKLALSFANLEKELGVSEEFIALLLREQFIIRILKEFVVFIKSAKVKDFIIKCDEEKLEDSERARMNVYHDDGGVNHF